VKQNVDVRDTVDVEYIVRDNFQQHPNPAASKAYSEASVLGSRSLRSRVTFTDSGVSRSNGVRVRDDRYTEKHIEQVAVDAEDEDHAIYYV
jgi:hypothetical protein